MVLLRVLPVCALIFACKDDPGSRDELSRPEPKPTSRPANVVKVTTLVPYGQKVPCASLIDPAKFGAALGMELSLVDKSAGEMDPTAVCGLKLVGKPVDEATQERLLKKNADRLGVLPGDEVFQLRFFCSEAYSPESSKQVCDKKGWEVTYDAGDLLCIQRVQAGPRDRHVAHVLDPDTKCRYEISPLSLTEIEPVKKAAKAAVELIGPDCLKAQP